MIVLTLQMVSQGIPNREYFILDLEEEVVDLVLHLGQVALIRVLLSVEMLDVLNQIDCDLAQNWAANLHIFVEKSQQEGQWMLDVKVSVSVLKAISGGWLHVHEPFKDPLESRYDCLYARIIMANHGVFILNVTLEPSEKFLV